jgi:hypothetical protein
MLHTDPADNIFQHASNGHPEPVYRREIQSDNKGNMVHVRT